jgi:hypothetical protein
MFSTAEHLCLLYYEHMHGRVYRERGRERDTDRVLVAAGSCHVRRERERSNFIGQAEWRGRGGGLFRPGPLQLPVHRSQWKFIFPIGHISFRIRLDSMLKLIRNYINPIGLTV